MDRLGEKAKIYTEVFTISSGSGMTSLGYSMEDCERITFICGMGTAAAAATAITPTVAVIQSGDIRLSTNATMAGLSTTLGPTTANQVTNAKSIILTMGTASTLTDSIVLNGNTITYSTTPNTTNATALSFGSTQGSTVAEGINNALLSLSSLINNSTIESLKGLTATTVSTAAIRIASDDTASTSVSVASTANTQFAITSEKTQVVFEVKAEDLNSTSKYVGLNVTTATTSVPMSITVIKSGMRQCPPVQIGKYIKST